MIKKSLRAYITRRQFIFMILAHGKVIRVFFFERVKEEIDRVFEIVVVLAHFHRVNHCHQRVKVLFVRWCFVKDVAHQCAIQQRFGVSPKWVAAFLPAVGIGNQNICQLQDILFRMNVMERVIVERLFEVDGVEESNLILFLFQQVSALDEQTAFGVCYDIAGMALHEIGLQKVAGFAAARSADDQDVFVPRRPGVFGAAVHGQPFRLCQQDVVFENGVDKRLDVLARSP